MIATTRTACAHKTEWIIEYNSIIHHIAVDFGLKNGISGEENACMWIVVSIAEILSRGTFEYCIVAH